MITLQVLSIADDSLSFFYYYYLADDSLSFVIIIILADDSLSFFSFFFIIKISFDMNCLPSREFKPISVKHYENMPIQIY